MADATQGWNGVLAFDSASPVDASSTFFEVLNHTLRKSDPPIDTGGIRGTLERNAIQFSRGNIDISGSISMNVTPNIVDFIFPYCGFSGDAATPEVFTPANTLTDLFIGVDLGADAFQYNNCRIGRMTLRGSPGQFIEMSLDVSGKSQGDLTFPSYTLGTTAQLDAPFRFSDGVINLVSSNRDIMSFEIAIDYGLDVRYTNSLNATSITPTARTVTLSVTTPFTSSETDLLTQTTSGTTGTLTITNGDVSLLATFGLLIQQVDTPTIPGKSEVTMPMTYQAVQTGSTPSVTFTLDQTV